MQSFVALSQTLPYLLAGAWLALLRHPQETARLRADPALMPKAVEELMRHASPSRAVFRRSLGDVRIGRAGIRLGERVILMLASASRDPTRFASPDRLDFGRRGEGHLAFGGGEHSCSGASLIRLAVSSATDALLRGTDDVERIGAVEWIGGFAIRAPASLPVVLRRWPAPARPL